MKTKFLFTAVLAAMAFTSCQKDVADQGTVQPGQDTYIGMTIQLPKSVVSRAGFQDDVNATEGESFLSTIYVGVWGEGGIAPIYTKLDVASDLNNNGNGTYTAKKAVKAKTGRNFIFVFAGKSFPLSMAQINGESWEVENIESLATNREFTMYSKEIKSIDAVFISEAEALNNSSNKTTVTLRRAVAKISVKSELDNTGETGVPDQGGNGQLTNIEWGIANQNTIVTAFPKFLNNTNSDVDDFIAKNVNSPFKRLNPLNVRTISLAQSGEEASVNYCVENAHGAELCLENNTTAVQVSATFTLGAGKYINEITNTGGNVEFIIGASSMNAGTTFYVSKESIGTQAAGVFFSEGAFNQAKNIFSIEDEHFTKYTDGKCFWAIWINDGEALPNYGVLRNHIYTMNITSIKAPGLPAFPDSEDPIAADTWISVDLDVEKWNAKDMGNIEL